ncbi:MAG TPA: chemotaxis protein CheA, partial [Deltaproteobacteria bacterium]|nr:chemotaxis protein CheA [Deltaproteobacteria bacterium]
MSDSFAFDTTKIKESFFSECEDYISSMESYILELEETPDDKELLNALFRAVHSIKGNSGCLGFNDIYSFTHRMETVLDRLRNGEMGFTGELSTILLESVDCIKVL